MSKDFGKKIKIMAIFIGVVGTVAGFVMAFSSLSDAQGYAALFSWLFLSIASLLLILPLYSIGNLIEEMAELRDKTRILSDKLSNISRSVSSEAPADKFSPSGRIKIQKLPQTPMRPQTSPSISVQTTTSPQADDFTRSLSSKTIADEKDAVKSSPYDTSTMPISQSIEPSPTLRNAFRTATGEQSTSKMFFTTSGIDTYAINRANNSVTKILPNRTTTISAGGLHSVFIYSNGRASAIGYGTYSQCSVADWANLISVAAGNHHTVGLRSDGSCVATGYNGYGQCNVQQWSNICAIAAGFGHTVGLLENGTCTATGDNAYGQCNVFDWVDIVSIVAGNNYTIGLKADGTIVAVGANTDGQYAAIKWGGISAVAAGGFHSVGLRSDGTCVAVGNNSNDQCEVSRWTNVRAIAAGNYHTVGLLSDGSCVATGYNGYGQCDVFEWRNVIAISAGRNHTLGLTADGTLLSAGDNTHGQCNSGGVKGIKVPRF